MGERLPDNSLAGVAVVVVHFGNSARTLKCLERLRACSSNIQAPLVVLVENSTSVGEGLAESGVVRVSLPWNLGYGAALNAGLAAAWSRSAEFVVCLNNDVELLPGVLEAMRARASERGIGLVGVVLEERGGPVYGGGAVSWFGPRAILARVPAAAGQLDYVHGACLGVTRTCFEVVGNFTEELFLYWEDVEYGLRARAAGFRVTVVESSRIPHDDSASLRDRPEEKTYYLVRNALLVTQRHGPLPVRVAARALLPLRRRAAGARAKTAVLRALEDAARGVTGPAPLDLSHF